MLLPAHMVSLCPEQIQLHAEEYDLESRVRLDPSPIIVPSAKHLCAVYNLPNCMRQPSYHI